MGLAQDPLYVGEGVLEQRDGLSQPPGRPAGLGDRDDLVSQGWVLDPGTGRLEHAAAITGSESTA